MTSCGKVSEIMVGTILSMVHVCHIHMKYMPYIELFLGNYMAHVQVRCDVTGVTARHGKEVMYGTANVTKVLKIRIAEGSK